MRGSLHRLEAKIDSVHASLSEKLDRHFTWLVGIQMASLVAILGALFRR